MKRRILIIDDDDDVREVAAMSLETVGSFEVICAVDGADGLERACRDVPDAILLDVMMPGMDGPTTFRALRDAEATRHIPVIMLSAKAHAADAGALHALGATAVLAKPFDPMQLSAQVSDAVGWT